MFEWDQIVTGAWLNSSQVSLEWGSLAEHLPYVSIALGFMPSIRRKREECRKGEGECREREGGEEEGTGVV